MRSSKADCPPPYPSILSAWREILPAILRQVKDPGYHVKRQLPPARKRAAEGIRAAAAPPDADGWIEVCAAADLGKSDVIRFDHGRKTYALCRDANGSLFATDGICTHGNNHLADGLVMGGTIECPKHNGRFHLADGSPARAPICRGLRTYPLEARNGRLFLNLNRPGGAGARAPKQLQLRVVGNRNVSTFIKELILEPVDAADKVDFTPGDYLQFDIPAYDAIRFRDLDIPEPYAAVWRAHHLFDLVARQSRRCPPQQLFPGQQCPYRIHLAPQRPPRNAAAGTGLPARGRFGVHVQSQTRRPRQCHRAVRRLPPQAHAKGNGVYRRRCGHVALALAFVAPV